jgi:signal transduction histidine kinase
MKTGPLQRSQHLIVSLGILPLVLAGFAYWTSTQHVESVQATLVTAHFIRALDELFSTVQDGETGQRGYVLTGEERYLAPFAKAKSLVWDQLRALQATASQRDASEKQLAELQAEVGLKMAEMERTIALRRDSGFEAALDIVRTNRGQNYMDRIRALVTTLKEQARASMERRIARERASQGELQAVLAIVVATAFLLLILAYRFSALYEEQRDKLDKESKLLSQALDARVKERTAELEARTRQLELRTTELARSNADLSQFAYVASHDLQEPLRMVGSYMGLLAKRYQGKLDETAEKYMQFAIDGANRMQALIQDLLAYSRAGTQALERSEVPFSKIVESAVTNLSLLIRDTGAAVNFGSLPVVFGDKTKLTQVMQNLIGNAIKFRKPEVPPRVSIEVELVADEWIFRVTDNGIGFDPKYCDRIFQVFQRLHGVGRYAGNGIGLAICRRVVEHHGGRLWAQSELAKGSTFFFSLPTATDGFTSESDGKKSETQKASEPLVHVPS